MRPRMRMEPLNLAGDDGLRISRQVIPYDKSLIACRKSEYDRERTGIRRSASVHVSRTKTSC